ncbi:MAG: M6 family metalloprotease domain-containing protein [Bacteroidales bacterium]|nr:M6 family metalloprotease domain-containing protein [Bacteroidales bacterium]
MKARVIILTFAALLLGTAALADPACPGVFLYKQPDGSVVRLQRHGDEFFSWTTRAGTSQAVELDVAGYWRDAAVDPVRKAKGAMRRELVSNQRKRDGIKAAAAWEFNHGERHIPVLLVNFTDVRFSIASPVSQISRLLNEPGYKDNGATGSVRDFYTDNSNGAFTPVFDVYGPVDLPHSMSYYGAHSEEMHDLLPNKAMVDAARLLNDQIDFSKYDFNNDGFVDIACFIYAGYAENAGGSEDSIWPHYSRVMDNTEYDGKKLFNYFCASELKGNSGADICGIGTFCHEFGHALGLPDFYDIDYEKNGQVTGLKTFSTMSGGNHNNDGRTPPYFNAEERIILGWMTEDDIKYLPEGEVSFPSVRNDIAYKTFTDTEGEYFVYECRDGNKWDDPLPRGMLVYHVDKSMNRKVAGRTPHDWWWWEMINTYEEHPCFYVVCAASPSVVNYNGSVFNMVFPGSNGVHTYSPVDWENNDTGYLLTDIKYESGLVSFFMASSVEKKVSGTVTDTEGQPLSGVYVAMREPSKASGNTVQRFKARPKVYETLTGADGTFSIPIPGYDNENAYVSFSKSGYRTSGLNVSVSPRTTFADMSLKPDSITDYCYYDPDGSLFLAMGNPSESEMAAIHIPASELPKNGGQVMDVSIMPYTSAEAYYIIIDAGEDRLLNHRIPNVTIANHKLEMVTVDLKEFNVVFPPGKDLYIGYAMVNKPVNDGFVGTIPGSNTCFSPLSWTNSDWKQIEGFAIAISATIFDTGGGGAAEFASLADMGVVCINDPGNGTYAAGATFPLQLNLPAGVSVLSESWTFDSADVTGTSAVTLTPGPHVITAQARLSTGATETLQLLITAN